MNHIKHPLLRQAFSIHPLLVGGNPFTTTSIYTLIHYLERRWGVFFCMGGTGIVEELHRLLERAGVTVELGVDIRITMKAAGPAAPINRRTRFLADRVICNGDPPTVYQQMLPGRRGRRQSRGRDQIFDGPLCDVLRDPQAVSGGGAPHHLDGATLS